MPRVAPSGVPTTPEATTVFFEYHFDGQECFVNLAAVTRIDFIPPAGGRHEVRVFFGNGSSFLYLTEAKAAELRDLLRSRPPRWAVEEWPAGVEGTDGR